jgi:hypothetical protein
MREVVTELERDFFHPGKKLPVLYIEYMNYLRKTKELAPGTINNRKKPVLEFIIRHSSKCSPSNIKRVTQKEAKIIFERNRHKAGEVSCIEGVDSNNKKIRIILSFTEKQMPIITVMWVGKE